MECLGSCLNLVPCLVGCISKNSNVVAELESNLKVLGGEIEELKDIREEVTKKVEKAEQQRVGHRRRAVKGWIERAKELEEDATKLLQRGKRRVLRKCLWGKCPRNCYASYRMAGKVEKMLVRVKDAKSKGCFEDLVDKFPYSLVEARPLGTTIGLDSTFQEAWTWLTNNIDDSNIGILGLFGMAGVGKTTLMTMINNEFSNRLDDSTLVIWVTVSKQTNEADLQDIIRNRVNLQDENWGHRRPEERTAKICQFLRGQQFVLFLDDLWEPLDLRHVGIPVPGQDMNHGKIIFTTRSQEVCGQMDAQKTIEVTCLAPPEANTLFNSKVGEKTLNSHPDIKPLAEKMAKKCGGLPIALINIGRAMSGKKDPQEWQRAIQVFFQSHSKFPGMRSRIYSQLRSSYDSLNDETIKRCFLYCAFFPKQQDINEKDLVNHWIKEGFIYEYGDINDAENQGFVIMQSLRSACLLEIGEHRSSVKMHPMVRDMALWIACQEGKKWDASGHHQHSTIVVHRKRRTFTCFYDASSIHCHQGTSKPAIQF